MIYFIYDGRYTKVGYSENPVSRLTSLQTSNARKLYLWITLEGDKEKEHQLHAAFRQYHHRGEWFEFPNLWHVKGNPRMTPEAIDERLEKWLEYPESQEAIRKLREDKKNYYKQT